MSRPAKVDGQRLAFEALALAHGTGAGAHVLRHAFAHLRALGVHEGVQQVASGAAERALVTRFELAFEGGAGLGRGEPGV